MFVEHLYNAYITLIEYTTLTFGCPCCMKKKETHVSDHIWFGYKHRPKAKEKSRG